jgi:hypothetical protein
MPKPKDMEKLAREAALRPHRATPDPAPGDPMPDRLWDSVLADPRAARNPAQQIQQWALSDLKQHVLRVACQRCARTVEIQKADAIRLYGERALWKDVGRRLLDQTCTNRTGRHEEDGCWPDWTDR